MKVITVFNQKGGVGKTTIAVNLSIALALDKYKILLIDSDKQQSSTDFHNIRSANNDVTSFPVMALTTPTLHKDLPNLIFDYIVVDAGGRDNMVSRSAVLASDVVIIPVKPSGVDFWATEEMFDFIEEVKLTKPKLKVICILNMVPGRTKILDDVNKLTEEYEEKFDLKFMKGRIGNRLAYSYSMMEGLSVLEYNNADAKKEFKKLYKEFKEIL